jgi:flavin-dependent dehydrogenase
MRAHIVIIGAGISGLTAAITIGEGVIEASPAT